MGTPPRATHGTPSAEDVLDAAARLLVNHGAEALSVRRVAAALGVSYQVVYSRFGDKPGLVDALYRRGFELLGQRLGQVRAPVGTLERITDIGSAYRRAALAEPAFYQVMFGRAVPGYDPPPASRRLARATFRPLLEAIEAAHQEGRLVFSDEVPDTRSFAHLLWGTAHGLCSIELAGHAGSVSTGRLLRGATRALLTAHAPATGGTAQHHVAP